MNEEDSIVDPEILLGQLLDDPGLVQHITRTERDGLQTIVAYFRIEFQPGQQRLVLHVPLVPALNVLPTVNAHATDHQDVRVRVTDRQKFGIRAEVILSAPAVTADKLLVELIASEEN